MPRRSKRNKKGTVPKDYAHMNAHGVSEETDHTNVKNKGGGAAARRGKNPPKTKENPISGMSELDALDYDEEMSPQGSPQHSPVSPTVDELEARYAELQQKVEEAKKAEAEATRKAELKAMIDLRIKELEGESKRNVAPQKVRFGPVIQVPKHVQKMDNASALVKMTAGVQARKAVLPKSGRFDEYIECIKGKYPDMNATELKHILELAEASKARKAAKVPAPVVQPVVHPVAQPVVQQVVQPVVPELGAEVYVEQDPTHGAAQAEAMEPEVQEIGYAEGEFQPEYEHDIEVHTVGKNKTKIVSGMLDKARSTNIRNKALWPQSMLSFESMDKDLGFDELSLSQLFSGELNIITRRGISEAERISRLHILKKVAYYEPILGSIDKVRALYKSFKYHIEKGSVAWGDIVELDRLETVVVFRVSQLKQKPVAKKVPKQKTTIFWCKEYNMNSCTHLDTHEGLFNNEIVTKHHICRVCFKKDDGARRKHRPNDAVCPNKE